MDLNTFLNWVIYSGGALLIASFVLDKIPAFGGLIPGTKRLINLAVSVVLAAGCYAAITYVPTPVMAALDPYVKIIAGLIAVYTGQQVTHAVTKD